MESIQAIRILAKCLREQKGIDADYEDMEDNSDSFKGYGDAVAMRLPNKGWRHFIVLEEDEYKDAMEDTASNIVDEDYSYLSSNFQQFFDKDKAIQYVIENWRDYPDDFMAIEVMNIRVGPLDYVVMEY